MKIDTFRNLKSQTQYYYIYYSSIGLQLISAEMVDFKPVDFQSGHILWKICLAGEVKGGKCPIS